MSEIYTPDGLARLFHETYERLAPEHGYETREASAVPWADVPAANKGLMRAVAAHVLGAFTAEPALPAELTEARCSSCDHLTKGHTAAGCWYAIDDHSPSVDGICPCTRVHKPAATPEQDGGQAEGGL